MREGEVLAGSGKRIASFLVCDGEGKGGKGVKERRMSGFEGKGREGGLVVFIWE